MAAEKRHVHDQAKDDKRGQDGDVQGVEPRERLIAIVGATLKDLLKIGTDVRSAAKNIGRDLGGPVRLLIPGELVTGVAQADHEDQQRDPQPPGELARPAISSRPDHLEQVRRPEGTSPPRL